MRRPLPVCVGLAVLLLGLRFGLGPMLRSQPEVAGSMALQWVIGTDAVPNVSYPLSPWLIYPLLGFVLGRLYAAADFASSRTRRRWRAGVLAGLTCVGSGAVVLFVREAAFFRWGTVSWGFFVLSLGVLAVLFIASRRLAVACPRPAGAIALRGVESFAVIPIHYALLDLCEGWLRLPASPDLFFAIIPALLVVSFFAAKRFAVLAGVLLGHRVVIGVTAGALMAVAVLALELGRAIAPTTSTLLTTVGQLLAAVLVGARASAIGRAARRIGTAAGHADRPLDRRIG